MGLQQRALGPGMRGLGAYVHPVTISASGQHQTPAIGMIKVLATHQPFLWGWGPVRL